MRSLHAPPPPPNELQPCARCLLTDLRRIQRTALAPIQNGVRKFLGAFATTKPVKVETEKPIDIVKAVTSLGINPATAPAAVRSPGSAGITDLPAKLFLRFLPFAEHLKARAVCKQWKAASHELGMAPPDADHAWVIEEDVRWAQEIIETQMERESQIWDASFCGSLINMLQVGGPPRRTRHTAIVTPRLNMFSPQIQSEMTASMRQVLIDWIIEGWRPRARATRNTRA